MSLSLDLFNVTQLYFKQCKINSFVIPLPCLDQSIVDLKVVFCNILSSLNKRFKIKNIDINKHSHIDVLFEIFKRSCVEDFVGLLILFAIVSNPQNEGSCTLDNSFFSRDKNSTNLNQETIILDSRPIALSIVELLDQDEHCIKLIWIDNEFDYIDSNLSRMVTLRTIAHAFDFIYPKPPSSRSRSNNNSRNRQKHISFLETHGKLYPKSVYNFLTDIRTDSSLKFGMHYETIEDGGSHEDYSSSSIQCKCYKFADKPNAIMFWGISESRLKNVWNANRGSIVDTTTPNDDIVKMSFEISKNTKI